MSEQSHTSSATGRGGRTAAPEHPLIPAGRVTGAEVYSPSGEKLGKIEDVALEKVSGEVAYAILSFGGFLGLGTDYHPVPWRMLRYDVDQRGYVIPCESDQLADAPGIRREELSGWDDTLARDDIYAFYGPYGARPYWMI